jgi:hypothetical protein
MANIKKAFMDKLILAWNLFILQIFIPTYFWNSAANSRDPGVDLQQQ